MLACKRDRIERIGFQRQQFDPFPWTKLSADRLQVAFDFRNQSFLADPLPLYGKFTELGFGVLLA